MGKDNRQDLERDGWETGWLDVIGAVGFGGLQRRQILTEAVGVVDGGDFNGEAALAQTQDFFQKEGVRNCRVPAEQVSDAQRAGLGHWMGRWERIRQPAISIGRRKEAGDRMNFLNP